MPQSSDRMRAYWGSADDGPAMKHLEERGFKLLGDWTWQAPEDHIYSARDLNAVRFLMEEWDFGGISKGQSPIAAEVTIRSDPTGSFWEDTP